MNIETKLVTIDPLTIEDFARLYKRDTQVILEWSKLEGKLRTEIIIDNNKLGELYTAWGNTDKPWYLVPKITVADAAKNKEDVDIFNAEHNIYIYRIPCIEYRKKKFLIDGNHRVVGMYKQGKGYCFILDILTITNPELSLDFYNKTI